MMSSRVLQSTILATICACALAFAVGCSAAPSSGSSAENSSAGSESAEPVASSAEPSSESESAEPASDAAPTSEASASSSSSAAQTSSESPSSDGQPESAASETAQPAAETAGTAKAEGYQVFEGTVHVVSPEELVDLQGLDIDPAMASHGGTYAVLVFDKETDVAGMGADGSGERTEPAQMLGIAEYTDYSNFVIEYGDLDTWRSLDGQHVTLGAYAQNIMFPSDVRLPMGEPSASEVEIL